MCTRLEAVNDTLVEVRTTSDSNYYEYFLIAIMDDKVMDFMRLCDDVQAFRKCGLLTDQDNGTSIIHAF